MVFSPFSCIQSRELFWRPIYQAHIQPTRISNPISKGGGMRPLLQILIHSDSSPLCKQESIIKINCMHEKIYFLSIWKHLRLSIYYKNNKHVLSTTSTCLQIKIDMQTSDWSVGRIWIGNFRHLPNRPEHIMSQQVWHSHLWSLVEISVG
jgi:hypothetical protein